MADAMANPPKLSDPKLQAGWENGKGRFLIDGFPRKMDQALMFDKVVSTSRRVLLLGSSLRDQQFPEDYENEDRSKVGDPS